MHMHMNMFVDPIHAASQEPNEPRRASKGGTKLRPQPGPGINSVFDIALCMHRLARTRTHATPTTRSPNAQATTQR